MHDGFDITTSTAGDTTIVTVVGDLDLDSRSAFLLAVRAPALEAERFVLDLSRVGFLDSAGISATIEIRQLLHGRKRSLHVIPSRRVRAALRLSGLDETVVLHDSMASALTDHPSSS